MIGAGGSGVERNRYPKHSYISGLEASGPSELQIPAGLVGAFPGSGSSKVRWIGSRAGNWALKPEDSYQEIEGAAMVVGS